MKTLIPTLLFLLCLAACNPFDTRPRQQINATAARVKAVVDSMNGPYKIILLQIDGKDYMDSLRRYGNIDRCIYSFSNYTFNLWRDYEPNEIPDKYIVFGGIKTATSFNDTLNSSIALGAYRFKNFQNYDRFDSIYFATYGIGFRSKKNGQPRGSFVPFYLNILASCKRKLLGDSLILENSRLKSKMIFQRVPKDYIE